MNAFDTMIKLLDQMSQEGLFYLEDPEAPKGYVVRNNGKALYHMEDGDSGVYNYETWEKIYEGLQQIEPEDIPRILASNDRPFVNGLFLGTNSPSFKMVGYMIRLLTIRYLESKLNENEIEGRV